MNGIGLIILEDVVLVFVWIHDTSEQPEDGNQKKISKCVSLKEEEKGSVR